MIDTYTSTIPPGKTDVHYTTVLGLLEDPSRWSQNHAALNRMGERTPPLHHTAVQWCPIGALHKIYPDRGKRMEAKFAIAFYLKRTEQMIDPTDFPGALSSAVRIICEWNDHHTTTHVDVVEMLAALEL